MKQNIKEWSRHIFLIVFCILMAWLVIFLGIQRSKEYRYMATHGKSSIELVTGRHTELRGRRAPRKYFLDFKASQFNHESVKLEVNKYEWLTIKDGESLDLKIAKKPNGRLVVHRLGQRNFFWWRTLPYFFYVGLIVSIMLIARVTKKIIISSFYVSLLGPLLFLLLSLMLVFMSPKAFVGNMMAMIFLRKGLDVSLWVPFVYTMVCLGLFFFGPHWKLQKSFYQRRILKKRLINGNGAWTSVTILEVVTKKEHKVIASDSNNGKKVTIPFIGLYKHFFKKGQSIRVITDGDHYIWEGE